MGRATESTSARLNQRSSCCSAVGTRAVKMMTSEKPKNIGAIFWADRAKTMNKKTTSYRNLLHKNLQDPEYAAEYLNAAIEDGDEKVFLLALRDVAEARGIAQLAAEANLNRESTYRMLSKQGNPSLSSLDRK